MSDVNDTIKKGCAEMSNLLETGSSASSGRSGTLALTLLFTSTRAKSGFVPASISTATIEIPSIEYVVMDLRFSRSAKASSRGLLISCSISLGPAPV